MIIFLLVLLLLMKKTLEKNHFVKNDIYQPLIEYSLQFPYQQRRFISIDEDV